jgi:hypothetical protein
LRSYLPALISIGGTPLYFDLTAFHIGGPDHFFNLIFVVTDDGISRIDNVFGGTVVLFESVQPYVMVIFLKIQYVIDVGPTKAINTLCIVSHHTDILKFIG